MEIDEEGEPEEKFFLSQKEKEQIKKFNVRCPQCKEIFSAEKSEEVTKIKCPHCGKEGIIK
jgi:DNA-directed RNA polymerase subunit RPC12/RpoP